ncbi:MAG: ribosomal protein S21 [Candidatus Paceibacteria bacterium]|jgi:ribosomal protein S21
MARYDILAKLMSNNKIITNIQRKGTENSASLLRRFSRRMRDMGIVRKIKDQRFHERGLSPLKMKEQALRRMEKSKEIERLKKLGKIK